ncbi:hypothetical protein Nepgr_004191 [Nepenthes gracilis]|uniref:BHLH domain-containing protein n=1 Tax=Nepenthes gracilis TaxID=150966 RepID=A0AAD3XEV1_NEPGR|nr:hypothetical protein Nepgr_004191 [Nepenthes gracilis]
MATHLQQLLQSLCFDSEWNYAVLWKLEHRARMVLTWEDAYYHNPGDHGSLDNKCLSEAFEKLHDGNFPHDPLGLALAKMSYHVYSLGEGIVGQVAVTGKHRWIFAEEQLIHGSSSEHSDGWQAQFLAGIQTIAVVAVVPHGVVLLGSLNKVKEDMNLVTHVKEIFSALQDSSASHLYSPIRSSLQSFLHLSDASTRSLPQEFLHEYLLDLGKTVNRNLSSPVISSLWKQGDNSYAATPPTVPLCQEVGLVGNKGKASSISGLQHVKTSQSIFDKQVSVDLLSDNLFGPSSQSFTRKNSSLYDAMFSGDKSGLECQNFPLEQLVSAAFNRVVFDGEGRPPEELLDRLLSSEQQVQMDEGKNMEIQPVFSCLDTLNSSFSCSAGYELHEVLKPAFRKHDHPLWEAEKLETGAASEMLEGMESCMLSSDSASDHLLEAVVANFCNKDYTAVSGKTFSASADSLLTTGKMLGPSSSISNTIGSASYPIDCSSLLAESTQDCLNSSESYSPRSSNRLPSPSPTASKEQLVRPIDPAKANKKRAKPGESCRPRPRDRQLIQDRVKELRELVPNGSKCSIDSLLERTIKHMLFLQSITKHADKLKDCAKSTICNKDLGVLGCSMYEQGSSWAVEVGGRMKVGPIVVENLNITGQLLIEMLCKDCDHFLEIAEAIKGLNLNILKGITGSHGKKTWMRFIIEGQNNRSMHRMDVLWSLVQTLQAKGAV